MNWKAMAAIALTMIVVVPIGLGYVLSVEEEESTSWTTTDQYNISDLLHNNETAYYMSYTMPRNNGLLVNWYGEIITPDYVETSSTFTSLRETVERIKVLPTTDAYTSVPATVFYGDAYGYNVRLTDSSGAYIYRNNVGFSIPNIVHVVNLTAINGEVFLDGERFTGITNIELRWDGHTFIFHDFETGSLYANPSKGWSTPDGETVFWTNAQVNNSVTFYAHVPAGQALYFGHTSDDPAHTLRLTNYDGILTLGVCSEVLSPGLDPEPVYTWSEVAIGTYDDARITLSTTELTVSGLKSWPTMGSAAQEYNTVEFAVFPVIEDFTRIGFYCEDSPDVALRVDTAQVIAGTYPTTKDYTLDLASLFPDTPLSIRFNSIGVYGNSIEIGDTTYAVENGRITIDGRKVPLKGSVIGFLPDEDGDLVGTIDGKDLGTFATMPSITFNGEWSLTATAYKVEEVSETNMTWQPGGFGLDREGFAAAGLITAGGVFVMLGMTGRMSGSKALLLAVICGASAFAYFSFL